MDPTSDQTQFHEPLHVRARLAGGDLLAVLRGRWYWVAGMVALAVAAAFYYLSVAPKVYQAIATVQVKASSKGAVITRDDGPQGADLDLRNMDAINTIVGKFKLPSLYEAMLIENPALLEDPELLPRQMDWTPPWFRRAQPASIAATLPPVSVQEETSVRGKAEKPEDPALARQQAALELQAARLGPEIAKCFEITNRRQTRLVDIEVSHTSARVARLLANALVAAYEHAYVERRFERTDTTLKTLNNQTEEVQQQLQVAHNAQAAYHTALTLVTQLQEQETKLAALLLRYREKHPEIIQNRQLLKEIQQAFMREFTAARKSPADQAYWKTETILDEEKNPEEAVRQAVRLLQARSKVLESEIENRNKTYDAFLTQAKGAVVSQEDKEAEVISIEPAREGDLTKPRPVLVYAAAGLGGLLLGAGLALLLNRLDNRIHTVAGLEEMTGMPVLASVAALRQEVFQRCSEAGDPNGPMAHWAPDLFFRDNGAKTVEAEMVRILRTSIILLGPQEALKTILFTSALPGEGKSFISANVAASFAMQGARTLLIDMDLRRPRQHTLFGVDRGPGAGVVEVLAGQCPLANAIHATGLPNLFLFPAGAPAPNPAELLNTDRLRQLIAALENGFDRIIIDTAPLLPVSDTRLISRSVSTCILVAGAEKTPKGAILRALDLLGTAVGSSGGANIGGCVLNGTVETRRNLGYNYSYGYYGKSGGGYTSYGEVYGEDGEDKKKGNRPKKKPVRREGREALAGSVAFEQSGSIYENGQMSRGKL
ncbi:MAG TPA: polysaccharide biosynthesis tyrosine autokinase [Verrucomicrobiales bacterium]|nr:polysaccharide biosynthesis tyrosine autokinase [Verrucomicrobiales bacterium]